MVGTAESERLVKSPERVRDLGEVFTPAETVNAMLDLLPDEVWTHHPSATFLEPACGDGNFLVAILERKLAEVVVVHDTGGLAGGPTTEALVGHGLEALASIYAVDISIDNVLGGTPGHEIGARARLVTMMRQWHSEHLGENAAGVNEFIASAQWIVDRNLLVGNMLEKNPDGTSSGRDELPILEYLWEPESLQLTVNRTTLGDITAEAALETSDTTLSLFGPREPVHVWTGLAVDLFSVDEPSPVNGVMPSRNGASR